MEGEGQAERCRLKRNSLALCVCTQGDTGDRPRSHHSQDCCQGVYSNARLARRGFIPVNFDLSPLRWTMESSQ